MWLPPSNGRTAAEFPLDIRGGDRLSPALLQRRNPYEEIIKTIAPAIKEYIAQKRTDEIANQLLNVQDARKATPVVGPDGQMISDGGPMDAGQVQSYNASLGYPGTYQTPDRGGQTAYRADLLYRQLLDQRQEDAMKATDWEQMHRMRELQMAGMTQPDPQEQRRQAEETRRQSAEKRRQAEFDARQSDSWKKLDRDVFATSGHHLGDWSAAGNKRMEDGQFKADLPTGDTMSMAAGLYQDALRRHNALEGKSPANILPSPDMPPQAKSDAPPRLSSKAEYDALPSGASYYAPDGKLHRKP